MKKVKEMKDEKCQICGHSTKNHGTKGNSKGKCLVPNCSCQGKPEVALLTTPFFTGKDAEAFMKQDKKQKMWRKNVSCQTWWI